MKSRVLVLSACIGVLPVTLSCQESKISRADLPASVQRTVDEQSQGATIKGFAKEVEHGKTYYEVQLLVNGLTKDVSMTESGEVAEVEQEVPSTELPPAVRDGLQRKAKNGKISKVESLTKGGKLVAYEAQVSKGKKHSEVQVGPDGNALAHAE